jgi:esterase/lipase
MNKRNSHVQRTRVLALVLTLVLCPKRIVPSSAKKGEEEKPPVSELEKLIQQTLAERNYDIMPNGYSAEQAKNWLNSQETSVKKEKSILNQREFSKIRQTKQIQIKEPFLY